MDLLGFLTLAVTGFISCADFGSYAFVHPVIRRLPPTEHITVEQGLLRTFGQGLRSWLLLVGFVLVSIGFAS